VSSPRRPRWRAGLVALGLFLLPVCVLAADVTPVEILRNPFAFAGQSITVRGTIANMRLGPMVAGGPITAFEIFEGGAFVTVISRVPPPCLTGSPVSVQGPFQSVRVIGGQRFVNLVEAFSIFCR
jgi:hypothetical protein